jgi:ribosomal protein S12 methylthiotransferase
VDGFFGLNEFEAILSALNAHYNAGLLQERYLTTPGHYAYLKISEGCNRNCAFCAIPGIRGRQISQSIENLVAEARFLASSGVKELILVAQDLTAYGTDIYRKPSLVRLLKELLKIEEFGWIRLHYAYPGNFPFDELIGLMKNHPKICRYLDIPFQHCNDSILKKMNRGHDRQRILSIVEDFRRELPGIAIRTTLITGFPGEGEQEFEELKDFIRTMKFERLGVFTYSHEEKTPAEKAFKDLIPEKTKKARLKTLHNLQEKIAHSHNRNMIGKQLQVIIDGREGDFYTARTEYDSPGVDNEVLIPVGNTPSLRNGDFHRVEIYDALEFDLFGKII